MSRLASPGPRSPSAGARPAPRGRAWLAPLAVLLVWAAIELLFLGGLRFVASGRGLGFVPRIERLSETQRASLERFVAEGSGLHVGQDPVLGWVPTRESNAAGMRDDREYAPRPAPGVLRIAAYGDSFTYGEDVALEESWSHRLARLAPHLEVLNYGCPAYGMDQAYLRYLRSGADYAPHVVLIGYMSENLARHVNVFRPFYSHHYEGAIFTKPRFVLRDGELVLLDNPVATIADHERFLREDAVVLRELGAHDHHYRQSYPAGRLDVLPSVRFAKLLGHTLETKWVDPIFRWDGSYEPGSEAYRVTVALFDAFRRDVLRQGALPIVVIFPDGMDQMRSRRGEPRRYAPLLGDLGDRGFRVIDLLDALESVHARHGPRELTLRWGHFSPLANRIAAEHVHEKLMAWDLLEPTRVAAEARTERVRLAAGVP